jgi:hypothetical protein
MDELPLVRKKELGGERAMMALDRWGEKLGAPRT